ncbi:hypothetical protein Tco_0850962 [Tanacetum coccineum]
MVKEYHFLVKIDESSMHGLVLPKSFMALHSATENPGIIHLDTTKKLYNVKISDLGDSEGMIHGPGWVKYLEDYNVVTGFYLYFFETDYGISLVYEFDENGCPTDLGFSINCYSKDPKCLTFATEDYLNFMIFPSNFMNALTSEMKYSNFTPKLLEMKQGYIMLWSYVEFNSEFRLEVFDENMVDIDDEDVYVPLESQELEVILIQERPKRFESQLTLSVLSKGYMAIPCERYDMEVEVLPEIRDGDGGVDVVVAWCRWRWCGCDDGGSHGGVVGGDINGGKRCGDDVDRVDRR